MNQGRGSAIRTAALVAVILYLASSHFELASAATYSVGDSRGWTFDVSGWPNGKHFKAGDLLVFKYNPSYHDVAVVDQGGYNGCRTPPGAKVYRSGNDPVTLRRGMNFFICKFPGHCDSGMKIAINAA